MLSTLKNKLAKEDYILFDMRGNRGGAQNGHILYYEIYGEMKKLNPLVKTVRSIVKGKRFLYDRYGNWCWSEYLSRINSR